jgi:DNA-binding LytR/AlgR family response regulator
MRIAVCDDDRRIREILCREIGEYASEAEVICFKNGEDLLHAEMLPDILFLDIEMPGINGLKLAERLRRNGMDAVIIFISGEEKYVWQAFDVEALQYLRKPISKTDLKNTLERAVQKVQSGRGENAEDKPNMMIRYKGVSEKVYLADIVYAEACGRKVVLHRLNDQVEYYGKISDLEKMLGGDFFRVHRAFLINLKHVVRYGAEGITLKNGTVSISKANYPLFVKRFLQYSAEKASEVKIHEA